MANKQKEEKQKFDYDDNTFFKSFPRTSFAERVAHWLIIFSYSFIGLQLFSIFLEKLHPFSVTPPSLFTQLLLLLMVSGLLEVLCIQFANIKDVCNLDFAKDLITNISFRFFYKKATVIASFDQIRLIGVSSRPPSIYGQLFSQTTSRYAILIMNFHNQLIQITDFSLSLEEANNFAMNLANQHMPTARLLFGEPNIELVADPFTGDITTRTSSRSILSLVDAATLPTLQAFTALLICAGILSATMFTLNKSAIYVFNTDLMIPHQPVFQLFVKAEPRVITTNPKSPTESTQTTTVITASETVAAPDSVIPEEVFPVVEVIATEVAQINVASQSAALSSDSSGIANNIATDSSTVTNAVTASEAQITLFTASANSIASGTTIEPEIPVLPVRHEPIPAASELLPVPVTPPAPFKTVRPVLMPLDAKIPSVDLRAISKSPPEVPKTVADKVKIINNVLPVIKHATPECSILPGYGIHPLISLGDPLEKAREKLGKPLAEQNTISGKQLVYKGITLLAVGSGKIVSQINITRNSYSNVGTMQTPQHISVGSQIKDIKAQFGPPMLIDGVAGLHFISLGVSFIPSSADPEMVGAIKVYQTGTKPN